MIPENCQGCGKGGMLTSLLTQNGRTYCQRCWQIFNDGYLAGIKSVIDSSKRKEMEMGMALLDSISQINKRAK